MNTFRALIDSLREPAIGVMAAGYAVGAVLVWWIG